MLGVRSREAQRLKSGGRLCALSQGARIPGFHHRRKNSELPVPDPCNSEPMGFCGRVGLRTGAHKPDWQALRCPAAGEGRHPAFSVS